MRELSHVAPIHWQTSISVVVSKNDRPQTGQGRPRSWQRPGQLAAVYCHIIKLCHVAPGLRQCATDVGPRQRQALEVQHAIPSIWQRATQVLSRVRRKVPEM